ncbi:unnamed protein product [Didymodactylos carnosus]|uniref:Uncharacterized protein n=1 Tax=Didymodactylos carnosus TaxID=1234261 RepID=A0A8S2I138_9BILA|nr:unnamed protein product [Didymodactylos carnosus]CAF3686860.1 unnamed protein product [Didymodactylos carnosus]
MSLTENLEDLSIVWLDTNSANDTDRRVRFRDIINYITFFQTYEQCIDYIVSNKNERIFFIVSDSFVETIVSLIYNMSHIIYIYIYCANKSLDKECIKQYIKVQDIFTEEYSLFSKLHDDVEQYRKRLSPPISICNLSMVKEKSIQHLNKGCAAFLWFQLLIECVFRLEETSIENAKKEMLDECRQYYKDNKVEQNKIIEFDKNYSSDKPMEWYTRDLFLYRLLNKAYLNFVFCFLIFIIKCQTYIVNYQYVPMI